MANPFFKFKQFTIFHDKCAMKVGTDAVLLGSWANIDNRSRALDIGTGTGIIALMLAQRSNDITVDAIDIDEDATIQAKENVTNSPFAERVRILHSTLEHFSTKNRCKKEYDLIVSNPPYFNNSLKSPSSQRSTARHSDTLPLSELFRHAKQLLSEDGIIAVILPYSSSQEAVIEANKNGLYIKRYTHVHTTPNSEVKRILIEFSTNNEIVKQESKLIIENSRHNYSDDFKALTSDFYL